MRTLSVSVVAVFVAVLFFVGCSQSTTPPAVSYEKMTAEQLKAEIAKVTAKVEADTKALDAAKEELTKAAEDKKKTEIQAKVDKAQKALDDAKLQLTKANEALAKLTPKTE